MLRKTVCLTLWIGMTSLAQAAPSYSVNVLGMADDYANLTLGAAGQIVADFSLLDPVAGAWIHRSVLFANGSQTALSGPDGGSFHAVSIADNGAVFGNVGAHIGGSKPAVWHDGVASYIDLPAGADSGWITGGNAFGDAVGFVTSGSGDRVEVLWGRDGSVTTLDSGGQYAWFHAYGVSDSGVVIGHGATMADEDDDGFYDDERILSWSEGSFHDLGPRLNDIDPRRINVAGQVIGIGVANEDGSLTAGFRIDADGSVHMLSAPGAESAAVEDINEAGWSVGSGWKNGEQSFAVLWRDGDGVDLNDLIDPASGLTVIDARAINDADQIAALAVDADGATRVVLLTPVPEPHAWALLLGGALVLFRRVRRQVGAA